MIERRLTRAGGAIRAAAARAAARGLGALRAAGAAIAAADCPCCRQPMGWGRWGVCRFCWEETRGYGAPPCDLCGARGGALSGVASRCGACAGRASALAGVAAWGPFEGRLRELIHALKFDARLRLARPLGARIAAAAAERLAGAGPRPEVIVPVPIDAARLARRGFDQAHLLAREARRALRGGRPGGIELVRALRRTGAAPPQTSLPRRLRLRNLLGAVEVARGAGAALAGRRVVLVDDVTTTGATLEACARALRRAGAAEVVAAVAARTLPPGAGGAAGNGFDVIGPALAGGGRGR